MGAPVIRRIHSIVSVHECKLSREVLVTTEIFIMESVAEEGSFGGVSRASSNSWRTQPASLFRDLKRLAMSLLYTQFLAFSLTICIENKIKACLSSTYTK